MKFLKMKEKPKKNIILTIIFVVFVIIPSIYTLIDFTLNFIASQRFFVASQRFKQVVGKTYLTQISQYRPFLDFLKNIQRVFNTLGGVIFNKISKGINDFLTQISQSRTFLGFLKNIQRVFNIPGGVIFDKIKTTKIFIWFRVRFCQLENDFIFDYLERYGTLPKFLEKFLKIEKQEIEEQGSLFFIVFPKIGKTIKTILGKTLKTRKTFPVFLYPFVLIYKYAVIFPLKISIKPVLKFVPETGNKFFDIVESQTAVKLYQSLPLFKSKLIQMLEFIRKWKENEALR